MVKFIDSNVAVSSKVYDGKTIKCWIFQKPAAEAQPTSDTPDIDLTQACSEFEQTLSEPAIVAPVMEMTEPCIVRRRFSQKDEVRHFYVGMAKAPIFALIIGLIGCLEGLQVEGTAQSVGERTTSSVVQAISLVIILDALAALWFMNMGW